jgi:hypothetical protein
MDHANSTSSPMANQPAHVARNLVLGVLLFLALQADASQRLQFDLLRQVDPQANQFNTIDMLNRSYGSR